MKSRFLNAFKQKKSYCEGQILPVGILMIALLKSFSGNPVQALGFGVSSLDAGNHSDTVNITFANGSTGVVAYYANGFKTMAKEYVEVFHAGTSGVLDNFKELRLFGKKKQKKKLMNQDKGQQQMVEQFLQSLINGRELIAFEEIVAVTRAAFAVLESIKIGAAVKI